MAKSFSNDIGAFLPTTALYDGPSIESMDANSAEFKKVILEMIRTFNQIALVTNIKESGYYYPQEFVTGAVYFPDPSLSSKTAKKPIRRQVFRMVVDFGALPNATSKSEAHGITISANTSITRIYGAATDPSTGFIPLPFSSPTLNENIKLEMDSTNVTVTTGIDYSGYTTSYIVIEYLQS